MHRAKVQFFALPRPHSKRQTLKAKCKNADKTREAKLQTKINEDIDALSTISRGPGVQLPVIDKKCSTKDKVYHFRTLVEQRLGGTRVYDIDSASGLKRSHDDESIKARGVVFRWETVKQ